jgi:hypothetical protein
MPRSRPVVAVLTAGGLVLLAAVVGRTGLAAVGDALARVGWGFAWVVGLGGFRFLVRSVAWWLTFDPEARPPLSSLVAAFLIGDGVSSLTALGPFASEPLKGLYVQDRRPMTAVAATLAIENVAYAGSVAGMLIVSTGWILLHVALPTNMSRLVVFTLAGSLTAVVALVTLVFVAVPGRLPVARPRGRVSEVLQRIGGKMAECRRWSAARIAAVGACELLFHAAAVLETYLVLRWIGGSAVTAGQAIALEGCGRFITGVFKFIPFRVGVDEAGSGSLSLALGLGTSTGVALALVRKLRSLCWTAVGLSLIPIGASLRRTVPVGAVLQSERSGR